MKYCRFFSISLWTQKFGFGFQIVHSYFAAWNIFGKDFWCRLHHPVKKSWYQSIWNKQSSGERSPEKQRVQVVLHVGDPLAPLLHHGLHPDHHLDHLLPAHPLELHHHLRGQVWVRVVLQVWTLFSSNNHSIPIWRTTRWWWWWGGRGGGGVQREFPQGPLMVSSLFGNSEAVLQLAA